jgi:hypothetical protein
MNSGCKPNKEKTTVLLEHGGCYVVNKKSDIHAKYSGTQWGITLVLKRIRTTNVLKKKIPSSLNLWL